MVVTNKGHKSMECLIASRKIEQINKFNYLGGFINEHISNDV